MTNYKAAYLKAKELIEELDQSHLLIDREKVTTLHNELNIIEEEIEKPKKEKANKELGIIDISRWLNEKGYRRGMDIYLGEIAGLIKSFVEEYEAEIEKEENQIVPVLMDVSESDKRSTIDKFIRMTSKYTLEMFLMLGLKTHIEAKVTNEPTKEEFLFSFKKIFHRDGELRCSECHKLID